MGFFKKKLETFKGTLNLFPTYKAGNETKKSYCTFSLLTDRGFILFKAFDSLADSLKSIEVPCGITVGAYKKDDDYIVNQFEVTANNITTIHKPGGITEEEVQKRNKEYEKQGLALVEMNLEPKPILVLRSLSETILVDGKRVCKLEFIIKKLGAPRVNQRLKEKGLHGSIKFTKTYSKDWQALKQELLKEALDTP